VGQLHHGTISPCGRVGVCTIPEIGSLGARLTKCNAISLQRILSAPAPSRLARSSAEPARRLAEYEEPVELGILAQ
jgi:hypothetical protein